MQAGCASLMALEASLARVAALPGDHSSPEAAIREAIELVRAAVGELQQRRPGRGATDLALGFVTAEPQGDEPEPPPQVSPRRTA